MSPFLSKEMVARFFSKVNLKGSFFKPLRNRCWEWQGTVRLGYGLFGGWKNRGSMKCAHRLSYEYFVGPISPGLHVLHRCDNPRCVNPGHLILGTHQDNMQDMFKKNRRKVKISLKDAETIRRAYSSGTSAESLAQTFGVNASHIYRIIHNQRRKAA